MVVLDPQQHDVLFLLEERVIPCQEGVENQNNPQQPLIETSDDVMIIELNDNLDYAFPDDTVVMDFNI